MEKIQGVLFIGCLIWASYMDLKKRIIPPGICIGLGLISLLDLHLTNLLGPLIGIPLVIIGILEEGRLGGGDIKLIIAASLVVGLFNTACSLLFGLTLAVCCHLMYMCKQKIKLGKLGETAIPLGPFLSFGFIVVYFFK